MKISTKAWHYRFMEMVNVDTYWRTDLCSYMRGFAWASVKAVVFLVAAVFAAAFIAFIVYALGYTLLAGWLGWDTGTSEYTIGIALWFCASAAGLIYVGKEVASRRKKVYKPDGVFKQYIKDKHAKVCRLIEFV